MNSRNESNKGMQTDIPKATEVGPLKAKIVGINYYPDEKVGLEALGFKGGEIQRGLLSIEGVEVDGVKRDIKVSLSNREVLELLSNILKVKNTPEFRKSSNLPLFLREYSGIFGSDKAF